MARAGEATPGANRLGGAILTLCLDLRLALALVLAPCSVVISGGSDTEIDGSIFSSPRVFMAGPAAGAGVEAAFPTISERNKAIPAPAANNTMMPVEIRLRRQDFAAFAWAVVPDGGRTPESSRDASRGGACPLFVVNRPAASFESLEGSSGHCSIGSEPAMYVSAFLLAPPAVEPGVSVSVAETSVTVPVVGES